MDPEAAQRCADDLVSFAGAVDSAIIVSDYIYSDAVRYDEGTETYRRCLADLDRRLAQVCDAVVEMSAGRVIVHKGELPV